jgi:hypothetical protein
MDMTGLKYTVQGIDGLAFDANAGTLSSMESIRNSNTVTAAREIFEQKFSGDLKLPK